MARVPSVLDLFSRFLLALQKLQEGYKLLEKIGMNLNCEYWPGTRTVLEESDPKCLKVR